MATQTRKNSIQTPAFLLHPQAGKLLYTLFNGFVVFLLLFSYTEGWFLTNRFCLDMTVLCALMAVIYSIRNLSNRFLLLCFNINYFLFLIGGLWVTELTGGYVPGYVNSGVEATSHTCHVLAISLYVVNIAYVLLEKPSERTMEKKLAEWTAKPRKPLTKLTQQIILVIFIVALVAKLVSALMQLRFVQSVGYVESHLTSLSKPIYIWLPESYFYLAFCLWMATNPPKKLCIGLLSVVLAVTLLLLVAGGRGEATTLLLLLVFCVYRRSKADADFIQIKKWHVAVALAMIPVMMIVLQAVKYSRLEANFQVDEELLAEFVEDQGISAMVVAQGYTYRETITRIGGSSYTFGAIRNYLDQNILSRTLFGTTAIRSNSVAAATSGNSFGSTLSYLRMRDSYLSGIGGGTSYVAEFFHDGGLLYLCIGSVLMALCMVAISRGLQYTRNVFGCAILLRAFSMLMGVPRMSTFAWLVNIFSVENLLVLLVLLMINSMAIQKEKEGKRLENRHAHHPHGG